MTRRYEDKIYNYTALASTGTAAESASPTLHIVHSAEGSRKKVLFLSDPFLTDLLQYLANNMALLDF